MTLLLTACAWLSATLAAVTLALLLIPSTRAELALWRLLRTQALRRWLTRRRGPAEPLDAVSTPRVAHRNLVWHLVLTGLFATQLAIAAASTGAWWRPLAAPLVLPAVAYFAGSLVQRQKVAIVEVRGLRARRGEAP